MASGNVYWIGQDGNVWFKSASGTQNMGKPINASDGGFDTAKLSAAATRIADPVNPPAGPAPARSTAPAGGSVTVAKPAPVLNQAAVDATNQAIGSLDTERAAGYQSIEDSFSS